MQHLVTLVSDIGSAKLSDESQFFSKNKIWYRDTFLTRLKEMQKNDTR